MVVWLEEIRCGMSGGELYDLIEQVLPKEKYRWSLCPGHLTADEEWMSSPVYEASEEILESGMMLQTDIIPSVPGYAGTSVETIWNRYWESSCIRTYCRCVPQSRICARSC